MFDGGGFYPPQLDGFDALGAGEAYRREPEFALAFPGITGFCGMARLLALMPWNRR